MDSSSSIRKEPSIFLQNSAFYCSFFSVFAPSLGTLLLSSIHPVHHCAFDSDADNCRRTACFALDVCDRPYLYLNLWIVTMMHPDSLRPSSPRTSSFLDLPPDLHYLIISSYLDEYTLLSIRHVNHYFYSFELPLSVSPPRSYATCVAFHRMWEDELLARHGSTCKAFAQPGSFEHTGDPFQPSPTTMRPSNLPSEDGYQHLLAISKDIIRPKRPLYLPCYECTLWLPVSCFSHKQRTAKRSLAHSQACKRFCITCGIKYTLWPPGLAIKVSGLQPTVIKKPEIVPAFDGTINSTTPSSSSFLLQLNSQRRNKTQTPLCPRCGGSFRSLWYCCVGCFNVVSKLAAQIEHINRQFNPADYDYFPLTCGIRDGVRTRASGDFWDQELGYSSFLLRRGLAHPMSQGSKNAKGADKASAADSNNAYRLGSEQMIGMEARCADCWRLPAFPAARDVNPGGGPVRETYANAPPTLQSFGMRQILSSNFCQRCLTAANAILPKSRLRESQRERAVRGALGACERL